MKGETMRRKIILTVVAIIYIFVAALGIYLGHRKSRSQPTTQPYVSSIAGSKDTEDTQVFVQRGGLWYHRGYCRELEKSGIPAKLSHVREYCRPCPKCRPQQQRRKIIFKSEIVTYILNFTLLFYLFFILPKPGIGDLQGRFAYGFLKRPLTFQRLYHFVI